MISSPAVLDTCRRCGNLILKAHSEGLAVRANPQPLDPRAELGAILAGQATYDLQPLGLPRKPYLWHRHHFRIAGKREWKVVADHRCPPGPHFPPPPGPPTPVFIPFAYSCPDQPPF
ncbi:hypothetical protein AB0K05_24835 [Nonomuraea sp. NPDC049486]|uniref:hypothetical protein n=1 Tax=Nonomuraea sp. NPDC049486 TaxID=3155773 RepID=UPI00342619F0